VTLSPSRFLSAAEKLTNSTNVTDPNSFDCNVFSREIRLAAAEFNSTMLSLSKAVETDISSAEVDRGLLRIKGNSGSSGSTLSALGVVGVVAAIVYATMCGCCVFMYYRDDPKKKKKSKKEEKPQPTAAELVLREQVRMHEELLAQERERAKEREKEKEKEKEKDKDKSKKEKDTPLNARRPPPLQTWPQHALPLSPGALSVSGAMSVSPSLAGSLPYPYPYPYPYTVYPPGAGTPMPAVPPYSSAYSVSPSVAGPAMMMPVLSPQSLSLPLSMPAPPPPSSGMSVVSSSPSQWDSRPSSSRPYSAFLMTEEQQRRDSASVTSHDPYLLQFQDIYDRRRSVEMPMMEAARRR